MKYIDPKFPLYYLQKALSKLNKYGMGLSKEEALKEFEDFIIADYRTLRESSPEELTEDAKGLLVLYNSYIEL